MNRTFLIFRHEFLRTVRRTGFIVVNQRNGTLFEPNTLA